MKLKYVLPRIWEYLTKGFWRELKFKWQRITRGYSDPDWWGMNSHFAEIIPKMVRQMKGGMSYPGSAGAKSCKQWDKILENIAVGFEAFMQHDDCLDDEEREILWAKYKKGMKLFAKWFPNLWD